MNGNLVTCWVTGTTPGDTTLAASFGTGSSPATLGSVSLLLSGATGGTAEAAAGLVERLGAEVVAVSFVLEIAALAGRDRLKGRAVHSLITY